MRVFSPSDPRTSTEPSGGTSGIYNPGTGSAPSNLASQVRTQNIIASVAVAAVIAIVITVLLAQGSTATRTLRAAVASTSCPASPQSSALPTALPVGLRWKGDGAIEVPISASDGPFRIQGDVQSCFAHSPMGAVIAAYDIFGSLLSPQGTTATALAGLAPGHGRQVYLAGTRAQGIPTLTPGELVQPVGFRVMSYTPRRATIETLASASSQYFQTDQRTLVWSGGDWRLLLTPDGSIGPDPQLAQSTAGFVLWGGDSNG
jgi:hypothetical protein